MYKHAGKWLYFLGLVALDIAGLVLAFLAAYQLRTRLEIFVTIQPLREYWILTGVLMATCIPIFLQQGLYRDVRDLSMIEEYAKIVKGLTYAFLLTLALTFFFKLYERSRVLILLYWPLAAAILILARFGFYALLKALRAQGWDSLRVALVGSEKKVKAIRHLLKRYNQLGYHVVAEMLLPHGVSPRSEQWLTKIDHELLSRYQRREIDGVITSDTVKNYQNMLVLQEILQEYGIPHRSITEAFDLSGLKTPAGENLELLLADLDEGQVGGGHKVAKRVMDEVLSFLLILLTLPLWILVMAAIKLDSSGPIFFRQERVGYLGKKFNILKFRSMYAEASRYAKTPRGKNDPRVTRIGAFLRQTSLDELPQLINVIRGEMSLVGPRPEMPFIVEKYKPIYRYRFLVKPGMTGLWQVAGRDKPLEENIKYDLYYIKNQSLLLDLIILLRTFPAVTFGRGAY